MKCTIGGVAIVLAGMASTGCYTADVRHILRIDAGPSVDASPAVPPDANLDGREWQPDITNMKRLCIASGRTGAHCREGTCATGLACGLLVTGMTIQDVLAMRQGELAADATYATLQDPAIVEDSAPFNGLSGGLCLQVCDRTALTDGCGTCATCSDRLTQMPLVASLGGALFALSESDRVFDDASGICRLDCAYDPETRGYECPDDMTCDAFTAVCVEQCTTDTECNTMRGVTYEGEIVTLVERTHPATCNPATGRCERTGTVGARVGDACTSAGDCAPGIGACVGGLCGELGCDMIACGDGGLCLGINDHSTICIAGCNGPEDCGAGHACSALFAPMGGFSGYCIDVCADDSECVATDTCTSSVDAAGSLIPGRCERACTLIGERGVLAGCAETEHCTTRVAAHRGWCEPLGGFCDLDDATISAASSDCGAGQLCDELLATGGGAGFEGRDVVGDGHCVDPCITDTDCTAPMTCITLGPLAGLCRRPCADAAGCTSTNEQCDTSLGVCIEVPSPT